ncbi:MAG: hypothetical protein ACPL4K_03030 [Candidatus Margulisiibacteriota bacterium]
MTYTSTIRFYDLSRYLTEGPEGQKEIDQASIITELSKKFNVSPEKIEIDPENRMSIIYFA